MAQRLMAMPATTRLVRTLPILDRMRTIEGWLEDDEADLLLAAAASAMAHGDGYPIVEIGSYCGRSTVVLASAVNALAPTNRVYAIDPHEGMVGAMDQGLTAGGGTLERFQRNLIAAGVADVVEVIQRYSFEVDWTGPIGMLLVDGLHDYENVARDFDHFRRFLLPTSLVAFHDYADYYPGVVALVDELIAGGDFGRVDQARSMIVLERLSAPDEAGVP